MMPTHLGLLLRTRRTHLTLAALLLCATISALTVFSSYGLQGRGGAVTLIAFITPVPAACVVGFGSGTRYRDVERLAGRRLASSVRSLTLALTGITLLLMFLAPISASASVATTPVETGIMFARVALAFCGAALLSTYLFGHTYSWIIPVLCIPLVSHYGYDSAGASLWWNVAATPGQHLPSWILAAGLYTLGLCLPLTGQAPLVERLAHR
ncbi:MAG: hypothetical protein Q4B12_06415 [Bowdeniella nasicola]|nr:hypothetical protein [Bowdeniella nasicola]